MLQNIIRNLRKLPNRIPSNPKLYGDSMCNINCMPYQHKTFFDDSINKTDDEIPGNIASRYESFSEETAPIIFDIQEEREKIDQSYKNIIDNEFEGINLKRGVKGVFDIEDLVNLLRREKAKDIFVVKIPKENKYADYMIIVTGKSTRHMLAIGEFIRKVYKRKMYKTDNVPVLEGKNSKDWMALDLGNIVLHVFSESSREYYDLETLWSLGKEFDSKINKEDSGINTLDSYANLLAELTPITQTP